MQKDRSSIRFTFVRGVVLLTIVMSGAVAACRTKPDTPAAQSADAPITLDPDQFQGDTKQAYTVARAHPELLAQLDCYCGCEEHEGHKNLLTCFRTAHGAGCDICIGEAVTAGKLAEGGMPVDEIRAALKERYAHNNG